MATSNIKAKRIKPIEPPYPDGMPPQNLDAERMVLGCILRDNYVVNELVRQLSVEHFYSDKHQKIYKAMLALTDAGKPIDPVTLGEELAKEGVLIEVGGAATIVELLQQTLTAAHWRHYSELVYEKAVVRNLIRVSNDILRDSFEGTGTADELLQDAERKIMDIASSRSTSDTIGFDKLMQSVWSRLSDRDGSTMAGIPSGFHELDELINGFRESELVILAARPSMGKTSLAMNFVEHAAVDEKLPVLFVSLEMSAIELGERILCSRAQVNLKIVRRGGLNSDQTSRLVTVVDQLGSSPVFIDDAPGQTMMRISGTARRLKLKSGLRMIVIDYLQLIESETPSISRQEQISQISRRLKMLAKDLKVPVIALSQLNRAAETREGHRPRMSDPRESGSIEQDADIVMLLHRDDAYDFKERPNEADLIIAKHRNGPVGDVKLTFLKDITRFSNYTPDIPGFSSGSAPSEY